MLTSLYSGVSGLAANGTALSVIGNNIANVNTVGFKTSEVIFEDLLLAALPAGQLGQGTIVGSIASTFTQGAFENTTSATDLAISGDGFFVVRDGEGKFYTRAGRFVFDADGTLRNPQGMRLQGWLADTTGTINTNSQHTDLSVGTAVSTPSPTTSFRFDMNLNAKAAAGETFSTTLEVFDSKGGKSTLTIDLTWDAVNNEWDWTAASSDPAATTAGTGSLRFDANGQLIFPATNELITITGLSTGAADLSLSWDLVDTSGTSNGAITSFASASVVNGQSQDGYAVGYLQGVSVDAQGMISGLFSNGKTRNLGQIALADFRSPWGLISLGHGVYAASQTSGDAAIGPAGSGGRGSISGGALELANVDLAREFVKMITAQRGFQANSRVITTADEVLADVVNLKR